ncbi:MAG: hypothetical protein H6811_09700 [Phycisphaeraceae bacterium]|nr:hypothetical protein [Phycisphaeraceae bacterium]
MGLRTTLAGVCVAAGMAAVATGDDLLFLVKASIHDAPRDGSGDSFNNSPFEGLIRATSSQEDRPILEYDASAFVGQTVTATIRGTIFNNNAGGTFPREFKFDIYSGNGTADLSDFQFAGFQVGDASWPAPTPPLEFSFDVTTAVQTILDAGNGFIGFRVRGVSSNLFPCILDDQTTLVIESQGGGCPDPDACGDWDGVGDQSDGNDFFAFLDDFATGNPCADLAAPSGLGGEDFFAFLDRFVLPCP